MAQICVVTSFGIACSVLRVLIKKSKLLIDVEKPSFYKKKSVFYLLCP